MPSEEESTEVQVLEELASKRVLQWALPQEPMEVQWKVLQWNCLRFSNGVIFVVFGPTGKVPHDLLSMGPLDHLGGI